MNKVSSALHTLSVVTAVTLLAGCGEKTHRTNDSSNSSQPADIEQDATALKTGTGSKVTRSAKRELNGANALSAKPLEDHQQSAKHQAPLFIDATKSSGLNFVHQPYLSGKFFMPEIMGSGVALIDYDADGDLDLYLVQGSSFGSQDVESDQDRLYKNWWQERGRLEFTDVTESVGLSSVGYGMGVAVADFNLDGFDDLLVTNFGANQMYQNTGKGGFIDVTESARVGDDAWSSSAAFFDADADGDPDLYVVNYVRFDVTQNFKCTSEGGQLDYCGPQTYRPMPDQFFENLGNGKFRDRSSKVGIHKVYGPGLGIAVSDFNGDGMDDIYVANDGEPNQLWVNRAGDSFEDNGLMSGTALNADGVSEAGMGVMAGDFDNDGDDDLFMTHLVAETNTLYINNGAGRFYDATNEVNLAANSIAMTGFGAGWLDFDNDGNLDLFVANGNVKLETSRVGKSDYPFEQRNQLYRNVPSAKGNQFKDVSNQAPEIFSKLEVSRGAAFGDLDNNGYVDVVLTNNNGPARVLLNNLIVEPWLGIEVQERDNRSVEGVRVRLVHTLERATDSSHNTLGAQRFSMAQNSVWRTVRRSGSYLSSHDARLRFGLSKRGVSDELIDAQKDTTTGAESAPSSAGVAIEVRWLDGSVEHWKDLAPNQYHRLQRGQGEVSPSSSLIHSKGVL